MKKYLVHGGIIFPKGHHFRCENTSELHGNAIQVFASHHQHRYEILEKRMLLLSNRRILTPKWRLSAIS